MIFITAFLTGLLGSLHCAGMCGPIALALPVVGNSVQEKMLSRVAYNIGRIITYTVLGFLFGAFGLGLKLAGFQQSVSIVSGAVIILMAIFSTNFIEKKIGNPFKLFKGNLAAKLFKQKKYSSVFFIGILNGLLPCGFVYMALAASVATQGAWQGAAFMALFGLGTAPMMFSISMAQHVFSLDVRKKLNKAVPVFAVIIGCLFMLRGFNLGIPYLSPKISNNEKVECCEVK